MHRSLPCRFLNPRGVSPDWHWEKEMAGKNFRPGLRSTTQKNSYAKRLAEAELEHARFLRGPTFRYWDFNFLPHANVV
jgi:hypothetical protein